MNLHDLKPAFDRLWWITDSPCQFDCRYPTSKPLEYMHTECLNRILQYTETLYYCECRDCEKRNEGRYTHLMRKTDKSNDKDSYYLCLYCIANIHPTP